jgi:outer membrane lipoprotein LolB
VNARALGLALVAALLAGCAAIVIQPRDPRAFDLLGRVSASHTGGVVTANVRWEHAADRDEIWLMTPTGQTMAHIVDSAKGVVLTRADREQHRAANVETLTRQVLGWPLPLSHLQYWVRGLPVPGSAPAEVERDEAKRLSAFTQNGWRVALTYHDEGDYTGKVRRVDLIDGPNRIRFVVDTWRDS